MDLREGELIKEQTLKIFRENVPGFTQVEGEQDYWQGICPWCGQDGFRAWGENEHFLCLDCQAEGTPEELIKTLEEHIGNSEIVDGLGIGNFFQSEPPFFTRNQKEREENGEISSNLKMPVSNSSIISSILTFLTLNLPGRELQIFLLLHLNGNGMTAREVSEKLQVPQSNIHRYLAAVEEKRLVYSEGKPKRYFRIEDARLIQKYCRGPITSKLK